MTLVDIRLVKGHRVHGRIFLSHAHADLPVAELLHGTLIRGGVPADRVFYSSARSSGVPSGRDVAAHLREQLNDAALVIELLSTSFLTRPMCLMELGGTWVLGTSTYPIVLPPLTRDAAVAAIGNVHMGDLNDRASINGIFDELSDRLEDDLDIRLRRTVWSDAVRDFTAGLDRALSRADTQPDRPKGGTPRTSAHIDTEADPNAATEVRLANTSVVGRDLHGEATNLTKHDYSMVVVKGTFYDADGKIAGTIQDIVSALRSDQTKTFTLGRVPEHKRFKFDTDVYQ